MRIFKSTQDFKAPGAVKEHTNEVRGGGRDPGVKRPGAVLGLSPARSKFFRAAAVTPFFSLSFLKLGFEYPTQSLDTVPDEHPIYYVGPMDCTELGKGFCSGRTTAAAAGVAGRYEGPHASESPPLTFQN